MDIIRTICIGIVLCLVLIMLILIVKIIIYIIFDIDISLNNIFDLYKKQKLKRTQEYISAIKNYELTISYILDKYNSKDLESVLIYYKLDDKIKNILLQFDMKDVEIYLRKKKHQKIK